MVSFGDLGYLVPGYNVYKAGKAVANSNAMTMKDVPTQFRDRDQIMSLINQGFGGPASRQNGGPMNRGGGVGSGQGITNQQAAQAQGTQLQLGDDPFRQSQLQQVGQLQQIASGQQQGAGELAVQRQMQQALAAQQAQARMARGGNAALAYRNAANQSAALGSTAAGLGQQAALQDQSAAQAALTGALGQGRGADISVAGQNANLGQQLNLSNAQMQQQQQQQNAANYLALLQQLQNLNSAELGYAQAPAIAAGQNQTNLLGGLLSAGGAIGGKLAGKP